MNGDERMPRIEQEHWSLDSFEACILDVDENHSNRIGFVADLVTPTISPATVLWDDMTRPPQGTTLTAVLTASAKRSGNPRALLVSFDSPGIETQQGAADIDLRAKLEWGVGADQNLAVVDVVMGSQVCLSANALRLSFYYTALLGYTIPPQIRAGGSLAYGARPGDAFGPSYTTRILALAAGENQFIRIPNFARSLSVNAFFPDTGASSAVTYRLLTSVGGSLVGVMAQQANTLLYYALPNTARVVDILNPNQEGTIGVVVRYGLAL